MKKKKNYTKLLQDLYLSEEDPKFKYIDLLEKLVNSQEKGIKKSNEIEKMSNEIEKILSESNESLTLFNNVVIDSNKNLNDAKVHAEDLNKYLDENIIKLKSNLIANDNEIMKDIVDELKMRKLKFVNSERYEGRRFPVSKNISEILHDKHKIFLNARIFSMKKDYRNNGKSDDQLFKTLVETLSKDFRNILS